MIEEFVQEALDSLSPFPDQLHTYRLDPKDHEPINAAFRAVHSVKGCAGFLALGAIQAFSHSLEDALDQVRAGAVPLSEELEDALIQGVDLLDAMVREPLDGNLRAELLPREKEVLEQILTLSVQSTESSLLRDIGDLADLISSHELPEAKGWAEHLRALVADHAADGTTASEDSTRPKPSAFEGLRYSCAQSDVTEHAAGVLDLFLVGQCDDEAQAAFIDHAEAFADWARQVGQTTIADSLQAAANDCRTILESPVDLDENLRSIIWDRVCPVLEQLKVESEAEQEGAGEAGSTSDGKRPERSSGAKKSAAKSRFVRVKEDRLDEFLEHVSRLFITSELLKELHSRIAEQEEAAALVDGLRQIRHDLHVHVNALQHSVVALRRVPVSRLFSKVPRMVRTLACDLGKKVAVHVSGDETEIDKALLEALDAPLTHLIRNAVDHGIDTPEERLARGLSETGNIWLKAEETRDRVQIVIRDDGRGIDPRRLRNKALEKGLVSQREADAMSGQQWLDVIFRPGFSSADEVSDVSGRGVGLDVVGSTLAEYDGTVAVESQVLMGTTFSLQFPVRRAKLVIDGLLVSDGAARSFVIPFRHIQEILSVGPAELRSVLGRRVVTVRDRTYDALTVGEILGFRSEQHPDKARNVAVLVASRHGALCLLADSVIGHRQLVVTDLKEVFPDAHKIEGAAQLGGGHLALVLNVPEILKTLGQRGTESRETLHSGLAVRQLPDLRSR
jgi:two-component system chemotaxis sensor kinase CheA